MSDEIDPAVIKKTQELLGKFVKKPPLTEKLLKKPPFRFLQDVVNAVIRETDSLNGLYSKLELTAEGIPDRNAKIAFLQKLIDVLKIVSNENISARPSKIVAGYEPTKTNELLQILGNSLLKKLDFKPAIEKVNSNLRNKESNEKNISDKKEIKQKKDDHQEFEANSKVKQPTSKDKSESKVKTNISKENIKEKSKSSAAATKISTKEKEREKQKKSSKTISTQQIVLEELEKIKKEINSNPTIQDTIKVNEPIPKIVKEKQPNKNGKNDVFDQIDETQLKDNKILEKKSTPEIKRKLSANSLSDIKTKDIQKTAIERTFNEPIPLNNKSESIELVHNELTSNRNEEVSDSPKVVRSKSNRKSSSKKDRKMSVENNEQNLSTQDFNIKDHNESPKQQLKAVIEKTGIENKESINSNSYKSENSQSETTPVKRQSTFTREESRDSNGRPRTSLRPPSVRPPSARPGAPKRRDKNVEIVLQPNDQVKLAGIQLKLESFENELDDDGENLVIIESENDNEENKLLNRNEDIDNLNELAQQGHLVKQILETQKELIQNHDQQKDNKQEDLDIATIQNRQSSAKQMNSLRDVIQNLTRSVNPLGKLMDFIPEDMDAMQLEMNMWRDLYSQTSIELKKEKNLTESAIEPMKNQLEQIENSIKDYIEMIDESRAKILQNSEKIFQLLTE